VKRISARKVSGKRGFLQFALVGVATFVLIATTFTGTASANDDNPFGPFFGFFPGTLVVTRSVYEGTASTVTVGETLPPGCVAGNVSVPSATPGGKPSTVAVSCGVATFDGTYPNVFFNDQSDGSFAVSAPIFLDNITTFGFRLSTLPIPSDQIMTSFESKSELALNLSTDGKSLTFMGYRGGPGFVTGPNQLDISNSNTPGVIDPTNQDVGQYYRAVAEVDAFGRLTVTETNAYSGDNGRAAIKGGSLYYTTGNDNNGNLTKGELTSTEAGVELVNSTGAELLVPGQAPPIPPNITMIGRLQFGTDKPGKDTNFRGLTIFNNTLYITKGSGGNGVNTVYQVGTPGTLPTGDAATLATVPITILPGFPSTNASTTTAFPFGIFFANANTLYVCDEGDGTLVTPAVNGNVATPLAQANAGLQKWVQSNGTWSMEYVIQNGLEIGVPYSVPNLPSSFNPATDGCRNLTGQVNRDGTVDLYVVTSTVSASGDQGADPNKLERVTDVLSATSLPAAGTPESFFIDRFLTIRAAQSGEVLRGVAFAPSVFGNIGELP
jgi:hypothetical protein